MVTGKDMVTTGSGPDTAVLVAGTGMSDTLSLHAACSCGLHERTGAAAIDKPVCAHECADEALPSPVPLAEDAAQTAAPQSGVHVLQQAAASQTAFTMSMGQEECSVLLRALTARSAVLARKNAKLRDDRDRLQARQIEPCPQTESQQFVLACLRASRYRVLASWQMLS